MLAGREWQAVHTPGHTLDHLCLWDAEHGVLLSGDHAKVAAWRREQGLQRTRERRPDLLPD